MSGSEKVWVNNNPPSCEADDLNGFKNENNNLIENTGQTLDTGDNLQTSKAVAVYSSVGDVYDDAGAANAYVLSAGGSRQSVFQLQDRMKFRFIADNENTTTSTVNINSLGAKTIKSLGKNVVAGQISTTRINTIIYDSGNDQFDLLDSFVWEEKILSANVTSNGAIADLTYTLTAGKTYRIDFQAALDVNSGGSDDTIEVQVKDGSNPVMRMFLVDPDTDSTTTINGNSTLYTMVGTSLTFEAVSASANSRVLGTGTRNETFAVVEMIDNLTEGSVS